ncbi:hypothetical protein CRUP_008755 [Coryphaenoides rupestris]|nr:hypothetical protein CRUP_008755 [Coryphaenoides rupestris]
MLLNTEHATLDATTQNSVHDHIVQLLREPTPLRCYGDDYSQSFYGFLNGWFLDFPYPNLTTFLSLMPHSQQPLLVNSLPPSHLGALLRRSGTVDDQANLCLIYDLYRDTPVFLENETLPETVRRQTLPCIWPTALSSTERSEVNAWFDRRLPDYLGFLTKDLLVSMATHNASCLAFQKLVSTLATHDYDAADFGAQDVYDVIRSYLASEAAPKCYDAADPELNSTAWFAEYIGAFMPFLTLDDLNTFGSAQEIQVFTVNLVNIALLNHSVLPLNLTTFYTELVYQQDSNFHPLLSPLPWPRTLVTSSPPSPSLRWAARAPPACQPVRSTTLNQTSCWAPWEFWATPAAGTKVRPWPLSKPWSPLECCSGISGAELIIASQNPAFLSHLSSAPTIVQQIFVTQIISVNSNSEAIIQNIPDGLATEIPPFLLVFDSTGVVTQLNRKTWRPEQAALFFATVAEVIGDNEDKASRRRGKRRVKLKETQLTCMYNHIREESDVANDFSLYPQDVLLYYSYALVPQVSCRSNSDPVILETLKNCPDFNDDQVEAMETLLLSGTTIYGAPATWNRQTLDGLGILPLYLSSDFYVKFDKRTKRSFLRSFKTTLRQNGVSRRKRRRMKKAVRDSLKGRRARAVGTFLLFSHLRCCITTVCLDR